MFAKDADDHRRIRGVVSREFSTKRTDRLRPALERAAADLCDAIPTGVDIDIWDAYAYPFAARVACQMVGIPAEDSDQAAAWAFDLARAFFPFMSPERRSRAERSAVELLAYMDDLLARRRREPADDLISILAADEVAEQLSVAEIRALAANMVFAGLEATAKGVSTGTYLLVSQGRLARLAEHPDSIPTAVLEVLRFAPPAQRRPVRAPRDGVPARTAARRTGRVGEYRRCMSRCRRYENPDEFDIDRKPGKQLAFGAGAHDRLGANLARLGLGIASASPARRHPGLEVVDGEGTVERDDQGLRGHRPPPRRRSTRALRWSRSRRQRTHRAEPEEAEREFRILIDGEWVAAESGETFSCVDPFTEAPGGGCRSPARRTSTGRSGPPGGRSIGGWPQNGFRPAPRCCTAADHNVENADALASSSRERQAR